MKVRYCPFCGAKDSLKESYETCTDYAVVGDTFRCNCCGKGFGFLLETEQEED